MSQDPTEDDGQFHTLGLLEQLRVECSQHWNASSTLYHRVDGLLRELANPNLHEIFPTSAFQVELWDRHAQHIRWVVAAASSVTIEHAAFDAAVAQYAAERLTLRKGAQVIREYSPASNAE
jgi:hypothetical protein